MKIMDIQARIMLAIAAILSVAAIAHYEFIGDAANSTVSAITPSAYKSIYRYGSECSLHISPNGWEPVIRCRTAKRSLSDICTLPLRDTRSLNGVLAGALHDCRERNSL
jgi:hypothetical protein